MKHTFFYKLAKFQRNPEKITLGSIVLNGVRLTSKEACENHLAQFFAQKSHKFYNDEIMFFPQKWQKVVEQSGTYFVS